MQVTHRTPESVSLALAALFVAVLNYPFWRLMIVTVAPRDSFEWLFIAATFIALLLITFMIVLLLAVRPIFRPVLMVLLPITAAASYFMLEYGVVIDVNMVRNVFETNSAEAGDLISSKLLAYVGLLGVLPAVLLWRVPIAWPTIRDDFWRKLKAAVLTLPLAVAVLFPFTSNVTSVFREHRQLRLSLAPSNFLSALNKYVRSRMRSANIIVAPYGEDAVRAATAATAATRPRKQLFVVAIGETARADHFGLNGYARNTTPELAKVPDLVNYPNAYSCGTDTAQSVPCIFSGLGRAAFSNAKAEVRENLLDILKRAGLDVVWRDNQAGCKGVCLRVATEELTKLKHPQFDADGENHDEVLLDGLAERIKGLSRDTVLVLHMMGSHGPAYWKRYPTRFEAFTPVCRESQFSRCTNAEIVNAYDNTIYYSDHVLARLIAILRDAADAGVADTGMIYVSDHGESLGENNIYLHGMPYAIAPEAQIHVPMLLWLSKSLKEASALDGGCLTAAADDPVSHDNLFHSILGISDVLTAIYNKKLDLFALCRSPAALNGSRQAPSRLQ